METNELIAEFMELETTLTHKGVKEYYQREYNSGSWYEEHLIKLPQLLGLAYACNENV